MQQAAVPEVVSVPEREDTIRVVSTIHSVVIGLAVVSAISFLVGSTVGNVISPFEFATYGPLTLKLLIFLAFMVTVVPFYHGAALFLTHNLKVKETPWTAEPVFHFLFMFTEAGVFYAMSISLSNLRVFTQWLVVLFFIDLIWTYLTIIVSRKVPWKAAAGVAPLAIWGISDILMLPLLGFALTFPLVSYWDYLGVLTLVLARTIADYLTGMAFYFPHTPTLTGVAIQPPQGATSA